MISQKSLIENINEKFNKEITNKIKEISNSSNIFVLYLISSKKLTNEDIEKEFNIYQIKFPGRTFDSFMKMKKSFNEDKYKVTFEEQGYFIDESLAIEYAKKNIGDLNEAGAYPFIVISSRPLNTVYPSCNICKNKLFEYSKETDSYKEIRFDRDEETKIIKTYFF